MKSFLSLLLGLAILILTLSPSVAQNTENRLRPGDSVRLTISGVPASEVSVMLNTYDISDKGTINLPYIGPFRAAGMTPSSLQSAIENAYRSAEIFTKPTIQITPNREAATQVIIVSGEVRAPGRIQITPNMTVHDSVTSAGGPTEFAKLRSVKMSRGDQSYILDLRQADSQDAMTVVQPGDKIHVP